MRVPHDLKGNPTEAQQRPLEARTATLLTLPTSCHHTVRSVAQRAYMTLWGIQPVRAERWQRVSNMDQVLGVGRPLRTITKSVLAEAIRELEEMGMPEDAIERHVSNFASLMVWADHGGFVWWGRAGL